MTNSSQPDSPIVPPEEEPGAQMTFFEHLVELRKRIINSLVSILIGAMIGWFVAPGAPPARPTDSTATVPRKCGITWASASTSWGMIA